MKLFSIIYPFIDDISSYKNQFFRDYITKNTHGVILEIGSGNGANINYYKKYKKLILGHYVLDQKRAYLDFLLD